MKGFFDFFSRKKRLLSFTERLSEIISGGIPLQKALGIMGRIYSKDKKLSETCLNLQKILVGGTKFSVAMKMFPVINAPEWYIAYLNVAEECGNLNEVLVQLEKNLKHEKDSREKFLSSIAYPVFVVLLTAFSGFFSVSYFLPAFSSLFEGNADEIRRTAIKTMLYADIFLAAAFFMLVSIVAKTVCSSPCLGVLKTMDFLSENSVPTLAAVNCAFSFAGNDRKISRALLHIRNELLEGEKIASCFGRCFEKAGYKEEGALLSENLSICEETGKNNGFKKCVDVLNAKKMRLEKIVLSSVHPVLILLSSIYITLILKAAFLPYITNFGGFI